jgi:biopolymer transport protein ExbB
MVSVFDIMAITSGADAKAMSAGVSRATIPTMAGMVASLSGVLITSGMDRKVNRSVQQVEDQMEIN